MGNGTCVGCLIRGAPGANAHKSHGVCAACVAGPIHIPCDRVRLCSEALGKWSMTSPLDAFQQWDTGKGAVVSARKFYLSPTPDGNVALVFRSDADAAAMDHLLDGAVVKPNRPLPLRYCAGAKGLCTGICFGAASDSSCLAHQRSRRPPANKQPPPKRQRRAKGDASDDATEGFLCGLLGDAEVDALSFESLRELCDDSNGPVERLPSPVHSNSSRSTLSAPSSPTKDESWPEFVGLGAWEGAADVVLEEGDLLTTLDELLGATATAAAADGFDAACFGALLPNAPLTPHLALPAHLRVLERKPSPSAAKWAKPSAQAARWRPRTDLGPTNKPNQAAPPLPTPALKPLPLPTPALKPALVKPAPKPKSKSKCIWKSAIVL